MLKSGRFFVLLVAFVFFISFASAGWMCDNWGLFCDEGNAQDVCRTINESGVFVLDQDVTGINDVCFNVTADDVVFDGNGHVINVGYAGIGIYANNPEIIDYDRSSYAFDESETYSQSTNFCGSLVPTIGNKASIASQAGINISRVKSIDAISVTCVDCFVDCSNPSRCVRSPGCSGGSFVVDCPANADYDVCVRNINDGAANNVFLGVKYLQESDVRGIKGVKNLTIKNLTIEGFNSGGIDIFPQGVVFLNVRNSFVEDVSFIGGAYGFNLANSHDNLFEDISASGNYNSFVYLSPDGLSSTNNTFRNVNIINTGQSFYDETYSDSSKNILKIDNPSGIVSIDLDNIWGDVKSSEISMSAFEGMNFSEMDRMVLYQNLSNEDKQLYSIPNNKIELSLPEKFYSNRIRVELSNPTVSGVVNESPYAPWYTEYFFSNFIQYAQRSLFINGFSVPSSDVSVEPSVSEAIDSYYNNISVGIDLIVGGYTPSSCGNGILDDGEVCDSGWDNIDFLGLRVIDDGCIRSTCNCSNGTIPHQYPAGHDGHCFNVNTCMKSDLGAGGCNPILCPLPTGGTEWTCADSCESGERTWSHISNTEHTCDQIDRDSYWVCSGNGGIQIKQCRNITHSLDAFLNNNGKVVCKLELSPSMMPDGSGRFSDVSVTINRIRLVNYMGNQVDVIESGETVDLGCNANFDWKKNYTMNFEFSENSLMVKCIADLTEPNGNCNSGLNWVSDVDGDGFLSPARTGGHNCSVIFPNPCEASSVAVSTPDCHDWFLDDNNQINNFQGDSCAAAYRDFRETPFLQRESFCFNNDSNNDGIGDYAMCAFCQNPSMSEVADDIDNNCMGSCQGNASRACNINNYVGDGAADGSYSISRDRNGNVVSELGCGNVMNQWNIADNFCQMVDDNIETADGKCGGYNRVVKWGMYAGGGSDAISALGDTKWCYDLGVGCSIFGKKILFFKPGGVSWGDLKLGYNTGSFNDDFRNRDAMLGYYNFVARVVFRNLGAIYNLKLFIEPSLASLSLYEPANYDGFGGYSKLFFSMDNMEGNGQITRGTVGLPEQYIDSFRGEFNKKIGSSDRTLFDLFWAKERGIVGDKTKFKWNTSCVAKDKCSDMADNNGNRDIFSSEPYASLFKQINNISLGDTSYSFRDHFPVPMRLADVDEPSCKFNSGGEAAIAAIYSNVVSASISGDVPTPISDRKIADGFYKKDLLKQGANSMGYCQDFDGDGFCGCPSGAIVNGVCDVGKMFYDYGQIMSKQFPDCVEVMPLEYSQLGIFTSKSTGWGLLSEDVSAWHIHPFTQINKNSCTFGEKITNPVDGTAVYVAPDLNCNKNGAAGQDLESLYFGGTPFDNNLSTGREFVTGTKATIWGFETDFNGLSTDFNILNADAACAVKGELDNPKTRALFFVATSTMIGPVSEYGFELLNLIRPSVAKTILVGGVSGAMFGLAIMNVPSAFQNLISTAESIHNGQLSAWEGSLYLIGDVGDIASTTVLLKSSFGGLGKTATAYVDENKKTIGVKDNKPARGTVVKQVHEEVEANLGQKSTRGDQLLELDNDEKLAIYTGVEFRDAMPMDIGEVMRVAMANGFVKSKSLLELSDPKLNMAEIRKTIEQLQTRGDAARIDENSVFKKVFDVSGEVDASFVSPRAQARRGNNDPYVVKTPKLEVVTAKTLKNGQANFLREILDSKVVNKKCSENGIEEIFPETFFVDQKIYSMPQGTFFLEGVIVQAKLKETVMREFTTKMNEYFGGSDVIRMQRAEMLKRNLASQYESYMKKFHEVIKQSGYKFNDFHGGNVLIGFKNGAGQEVSFDAIMDSSTLPAEVRFFIRSYEAGGAVFVGRGKGGFTDGGLRALEDVGGLESVLGVVYHR